MGECIYQVKIIIWVSMNSDNELLDTGKAEHKGPPLCFCNPTLADLPAAPLVTRQIRYHVMKRQYFTLN